MISTKNSFIHLGIIIQFLFCSISCQSQLDTNQRYSFIRYDADTFEQANQLDSLYAKLQRISKGSSEIVQVFHIGDSHIQGDFFSGQTRNLLQGEFGNAGRGLMFPYKAAKTNGPLDYKSSFEGNWLVNRAILPIKNNSNGLAAYSISTKTFGSYILFDTKYCDSMNLLYTQTLKIPKDSRGYPFKIRIKDWSNNQEYVPNYETFDAYYTINFKQPSCKWGISFEGGLGEEFIFHGLMAFSNKPGVIYNNIGVNGIQAKHYLNNTRVFKDISTFSPDLIIISLGTNEAQDYKKTVEQFSSEMDSLIDCIKISNATVPIIITTPNESYKFGRPNPIINKVVEAWKNSAQNKNVMLWDMYYIGGGKFSSNLWIQNGLFSRDRVHQSIKGYRLQGDLLYQAIQYHYQQYVVQHP